MYLFYVFPEKENGSICSLCARMLEWSGLPCLPPSPGIKPPSLTSPALAVASLPLAPLGKPNMLFNVI